MSVASAAVSHRDESDGGAAGSGGKASSFCAVFAEALQSIGQQRNQGSRAASGPPTFELRPEGSHKYDPSFYHLRKTEHQHAMDITARLRRRKLEGTGSKGGSREGGNAKAGVMVLPFVAEPPRAHPRFVSSRLLLHLSSTYAAIRKYLLYVLFNGSWLPPNKPEPDIAIAIDGAGDVAAAAPGTGASGGAHGSTAYRRTVSGTSNRSAASATNHSFSPETVAASSKSFLEVLHILTLKVHTLEECGRLHRALPFLDHEQKGLSSGIIIDSYLDQLVAVPDSLLDVWALQCAPPKTADPSSDCSSPCTSTGKMRSEPEVGERRSRGTHCPRFTRLDAWTLASQSLVSASAGLLCVFNASVAHPLLEGVLSHDGHITSDANEDVSFCLMT